MIVQKGGQVTKPIIVVKMPCKLSYVIQVKGFLIKCSTSTKGGQVTKPIIVVKMPCKLSYVIQVKGFLIKCSTSWPYLISEVLVAYNHCGF